MSKQAFDYERGIFVGRIWNPQVGGPSLITAHGGEAIDITSRTAPTMRDLLELDEPAEYVRFADGQAVCAIDDLLDEKRLDNQSEFHLLAPNDLQAVKAAGVTFANSMVERVIEERAAGKPELAARIRERVTAIIGDSLRNLKAGSPEALKVKETLLEEGLWSQYLEVGIGPDAEVFTKAQILSSVGHLSDIGLHPISKWNNPEPEVVLAVNSKGIVQGATLGNDVNLRDVEGRSALLLSKAKDNNASCSIGPFIRLFETTYSLNDVRQADLALTVRGKDGYVLKGNSSMKEISRDPLDLVSQTIGRHHQYPDGFVLFMGTLFAPTDDRDVLGEGFTHKLGDVVSIQNDMLGVLTNTVRLSTECKPWTFGVSHLMKNLAVRQLI